MDMLTALQAAHAPLTLDELQEYCGPMFSNDRLETLIRTGEIKEIPNLPNVYWFVPDSMKKKTTTRKCQSPLKENERKTLIQQVLDLRIKINSLSKEVDSLMLRKDEFPTQKQLNDHMNRLHKYNETKDIGQLILGHLAEMEHKKIQELHEEYNLTNDD
ncbi:DNA repair protein SWI5 [Histomonas meleagridis]|uniref:DNA repair protein SWI5-like n=1 Tax=Histomonas meleagridis TaxID=135588 RepID=UPI003559B742|nr:DNA repair protein SWI5 [Histomonas meleagridis]KAH0799408.1 DNA repair protein SWI5-like [Histomonas meleagridis]